MKMNPSKTLMKCVGATLAVCSVMSIVGGAKAGSMGSMNKAKKSVRKTINKMADVVDTIAAVM